MFSTVLALCFLLKIIARSNYFAPKLFRCLLLNTSPKDKSQERKLTKDALKNNDYPDYWFIKQTESH